MIPVASAITQTDTLPGEEIEFSIGDPRWVMRTQADLYSNRELAVTREYSTNAFDANKEKALLDGTEIEPIEVTLPSMMNPYFKVRDFGYGMSRSVMAEVYTKFGESTKRDSNQFNGMLGYGCKSAIAYTESFNVVSIHNGIKTIAVISRRPDWSIVMKIISSAPTNERSGTEITVPVHNWQEFAHKAKDFYKFWMKGSVKVNGEFPEQAVGEKLTDNLYYSNSTGWDGTSYVVMGNVPYRIENPEALFRDTRMNHIHFVAYVDNGDVEFTPSREDLKYTQHTKDTLKGVIRGFEQKIISEATAEINAAKTHAEAYTAWEKWTSSLGKAMFADLTFNGDRFQDDFSVNAMRWSSNVYRYSAHRINRWSVSAMSKTLVVTGFTPDLNSNHKNKVREYAKLKNLDVSYVLFTAAAPSDIKTPWVDTTSERFVDWEDLKAALPKRTPKPRSLSTGPSRIPGSFDYWTKDGMHYEKPLPANKTVYYIRIKDESEKGETKVNVRQVLTLLNDDSAVIRLGENRINKFTRENPQAKNFMTIFPKKVVTKSETLLSADAKRVLSFSSETQDWIRKFDLSKLDDPAFKEAADLIAQRPKLLEAYDRNYNLAVAMNMRYNVERHGITAADSSLLKNYPLLDTIRNSYYSRLPMEHVYIYMNAAYAAAQKKGN